MPKAFISYRRSDSLADARHLREGLRALLPHFEFIRDLDDIPPGVDFIKYLTDAISSCDVLIVLIGRQWLAAGPGGASRLENADDVVRMEIRLALEQGKSIVPILMYGATMPQTQQLPSDIAALARLNAVPVEDRTWHHDLQALARGLRQRTPIRYRRDQSDLEPAAATAGGVGNRIDSAASGAAPARGSPPQRSVRQRKRSAWIDGVAIAALVGVASLAGIYALLVAINLFDERPIELPASAGAAVAAAMSAGAPPAKDVQWSELGRLRPRSVQLVAGCLDLAKWNCSSQRDAETAADPAFRSYLAKYAAIRDDPAVAVPRAQLGPLNAAIDISSLFGYYFAATHSLAQIAAELQTARRPAALRTLTSEIEFHRRMSAGTDDALLRALSVRVLHASLKLADDALSRVGPASGPATVGPLWTALRPLDASASDLAPLLLADLRLQLHNVDIAAAALVEPNPEFADLFKDLRTQWRADPETPSPPLLTPFGSRWANLLARPLFNRQATRNHLLAQFRFDVEFARLAPTEFDDTRLRGRWVMSSSQIRESLYGVRVAYNYSGKHYLKAIRSADPSSTSNLAHIERMFTDIHDTQALLALLRAKLHLRLYEQRSALPDDIRDPYTGRPLSFDPDERRITVTMKGRLRGIADTARP
jgi:hypothetical protein